MIGSLKAECSTTTARKRSALLPSEKALADSTALIVSIPSLPSHVIERLTMLQCAQYPNREYVMIGSLKAECTATATAKRHEDKRAPDDDSSLDAQWVSEYAEIDRRHEDKRAPDDASSLDAQWVSEYAEVDELSTHDA